DSVSRSLGPVVERDESHSGDETRVLGEEQCMQLLRSAAIPMPRQVVVGKRSEIAAAVSQLAFPVVAKIVDPVIGHRAKVGAIALDLQHPEAVEGTWDEFSDRHGVKSMLVAEQVEMGVELLIGVASDAVF